MTSDPWSVADREQLERRSIAISEAERQLALLRRADHYVDLIRPCTVGDGIQRIAADELPRLQRLHAEEAEAGRFTKFVPASGAASRMFATLVHFERGPGREIGWSEAVQQADSGDPRAAELVALFRGLAGLPFRDALEARLGRSLAELDPVQAYPELLAALVGPDGLDYAGRAKGLLPFHRYEDHVRTALEEHLVEAVRLVRDRAGLCRLHVTVSQEHLPRFRETVASVAQRHGERFDARFEVGYSIQKPSTDTLALDDRGRPLRDAAGRLRFRPGGHGALIENLNDLQADLLFVKNIDNVQPDHRKEATLVWKPALAGHLVELQREIREQLHQLRSGSPDTAAVRTFARERLGLDPGPDAGDAPGFWVERLDRPLRVCGVVPNTGEPGGGPFWVRQADGSAGLQIVETSQVAPEDPSQQERLRGSTHFNPVDLVCAVRDAAGRPYDLRKFVDPDAAIVTTKSEGGHELRVLERPGLWNGGMAGWNTVFVEVPLETFSPVKTLLDLLREEHQPAP